MTKVAVVAHAGKTVGGGLPELRTELARRGVERPLWYEVPKSRKVPKRVQEALDAGAELVIAWGGDGTVQRCIDVMAGSDAKLAVVPAGTANLFASNLGIPSNIAEAVDIGLHGATRTIDVGRMKGERFGVMAGAGLDARMIRDADGTLKDRLGRLAYVWTGLKGARSSTFGAKIEVDGVPWYEGEASLVLAGNLGKLFAGVEVFEDARPDDGRAGARHRARRRARRVGADGRARRGRDAERVALRPADAREHGARGARPQGPVRARRRRARPRQAVQDRGRAGGDRRPRAGADGERQVSTATRVPETHELTGDDARKTLSSTGTLALLRDSFERMRASDGFSHARALAFTTSLALVQGAIVLVGLASAFGETGFNKAIVEAIETAVPGHASDVLRNAVEQANRVGNENRYLPLLLGLVGLLITSTTTMGQLERVLNRLYGIEKDRPSHIKYARALVLALSVGAAIAAAFVLLTFGRGLVDTAVGRVLRLAARDRPRRGRPGRAVPLRAEPQSACLVLALVRLRRRGRAVDDRHAPARRGVPSQLELRRHLRPARGHRRPPDLDVARRRHRRLRRRGHRPARGRPRRRKRSS